MNSEGWEIGAGEHHKPGWEINSTHRAMVNSLTALTEDVDIFLPSITHPAARRGG